MMAGEDLATLGIKVDAPDLDATPAKLDAVTAAGGRAEKQFDETKVSATEFSAALKLAGGDLTKVAAILDGTAASSKNAGAGVHSIAVIFREAATASGFLNAQVGITDTAFKSASASAAVFGTSLAGLSALNAATVQVKGLGAEMLALKAIQDGANFNATVSSIAGIGEAAKSARDSAAVFGEAQKLATLQAEEAGLVFYEETNALLGVGVAYKSARDSAAVFTAELLKQEAAVASGIATFSTLGQAINASLGLTDAAFKSASASAAVFEQSLAGVNALSAATVVAQQEVAVAVAESAAVQVVASEAVAAHATGSSLKVRESLVLMREASRGDFTRMAGSATIMLQALGLLSVVFVPLLITLGVLGSAFALLKNQINSGADGTGDLTRGLGLTAQELERVKNRYVSFGDTIKAVGQVIWERIGGVSIAETVQKVWNGIAEFISGAMKYVVGTVLGGVRLIEEAWKAMPTILGGEGTTAGINFAKAFQSGLDDGNKAVDNFYADIAKKARENAIDRILKEAKVHESQDGALKQAEKMYQQILDQTQAYEGYNKELAQGSSLLGEVLEKQKTDSALKSIIARIELDTKLTLQEKAQIIKDLRNAQHNLNVEEALFATLQETAHNAQSLALLEREFELIGSTNVERAKELALLRGKQDLLNHNIDPNSDAGKTYLSSVSNVAGAQASVQEATDAYNNSLSLQSELMQEISSHAQKMASTLSESFGTVGTAIEGLTSAFLNYSEQQAKFGEEETALAKLRKDNNPDIAREIALTQKKGDAETEYYADVLGASKQFFEKGSAGYKILQAAETAYRAYQLASSIAGIAAKWTETTAVVTANSVQTASAATTAVANAAADVPFPFNLGAVATVVALLAGFGILAGGSGGGGATVPPVDPAKDRQASQGAGSVLGDAAAKSDSIANSLEQLSKNTNRDLEYSNQMVISLRAIQNSIGSLTALLARQLKVGGLFDTSSLGLGSSSSGGSGLIGGLISSIFGSSSSSTTLLDQGIKIAATTIGAAAAGSIAASTYQTTKTDSKSSSLFGLISSSSSSTNTKNTALGSQFTSTISDIVSGLRGVVLDAAKKLGVEGAEGVIDSFSVNIGSISFKDMTGTEIQDTLNQVFSALGDQIAEAAIPVVAELQKVGEGSLETLVRLAKEYEVVDDAAKTVGFTFSKVGVDSLIARDRLVELSGGLDDFTSQASFFVDNFLTSAQAMAPIQRAVSDEMNRLNVSSVRTKTQFASLVQGIDTSTASGAKLYASLMAVAPAFAKVADAAQSLADKQLSLEIKLLQLQGNSYAATALQRQKEMDALDDSLKPLQGLVNAAQDLSDVLSPVIKQMTDFSNSLSAFLRTLTVGPVAGNSISRQYAVTKSIFSSTAAAAANGDPIALGQLQQVSSDFLSASKAASSTSLQYARDLAAVRSAVTTAQLAAQKQVDVATAQLSAIQSVNKSVLTVADAVNNYAKAQLAYNAYLLAHPANDVSSSDVAQQIADAIAKTNNPANDNADAYNSALSQLNSIASSALDLLHKAGVYAEWAQQTDVPGGNLGSFSVGSNLWNDSNLSGVLGQFQAMQQQYISTFQNAQSLYAQMPGHADGLGFVPRDNYAARLHRGERVLTANENSQYSGSDDVVAQLKILDGRLQKIERHTQDSRDVLKRYDDGDGFKTKVI